MTKLQLALENPMYMRHTRAIDTIASFAGLSHAAVLAGLESTMRQRSDLREPLAGYEEGPAHAYRQAA